MVEIDGKVLCTEEWNVSFPYLIRDILEYQDAVVVLLNYSLEKDGINSVYGVKDGEMIWRIQDASEYNSNFKRGDKFYAGIRIYEEDPKFVIATTNRGVRFVIDPLTGKIVKQESSVR